MDRFEKELREAMGRVEPPAGFAGRVLARVAAEQAKPGLLERMWTAVSMPRIRLAAVAAAMCLVVFAGIGFQREARRRAEGEKAKQQVMMALEITAQKMHLAQRGIERMRTGRR